MIDQNTIVEIVNEALPAIASSTVLIRLLKSVEGVIKTLYTPRLTLRNGKAEVDVEIYRKKLNNELLENQAFTLYEINKLKNFVRTAYFAAEELSNDNDIVPDESVDFDWVMRFFDAVGNVSNEEMQKLWGKILAGEIRQPGACSLRTMDIIRNMSLREARIYDKLCELVLISGDCYFICNNGFSAKNGYNSNAYDYISGMGFTYSDSIIPLIECGLLSVDNSLATDFVTDNILEIYNQRIVCLVIADETEESYISLEPYFLTRSGMELYNIIKNTVGYKADMDYPIYCFRELQVEYPDLTISAHKIIGVNEFDPNDLL